MNHKPAIIYIGSGTIVANSPRDSNKKICAMPGNSEIDRSIQGKRQLHRSYGRRIPYITNMCTLLRTIRPPYQALSIQIVCILYPKSMYILARTNYNQCKQESSPDAARNNQTMARDARCGQCDCSDFNSIEYTTFGVKETAFFKDMATKCKYKRWSRGCSATITIAKNGVAP